MISMKISSADDIKRYYCQELLSGIISVDGSLVDDVKNNFQ
jgi:hypothetical protein